MPNPRLLFLTSLTLGLAGNFLLRADAEPALNLFLLIAGLAIAGVVLHARAGLALSTESATLIAAGVLILTTLAWRDAPLLKLIALWAAFITFALSAFRSGAAWVRSSGAGEQLVALFMAGVHAGLGALLALFHVDWNQVRAESRENSAAQRAITVARGLLIAIPLLVVFGGLLISADAVFAQLVRDTLRIDLATLAGHVVLIGVLTWVAAGALTGLLRGTRTAIPVAGAPRGGVMGAGELGVALGLVALLFAAFVIVQLRYLFGGADIVAVTRDLTYADYARRGFFELLAVALLTLPLLLVSSWLLRRDTPGAERTFRALAGTVVVLVAAIGVSAVKRMRLYVDVYGWTEDRFYATVMLLLIMGMLVWLAATALSGRGERFASGALGLTLATGALLIVMNPDAMIARANIDRGVTDAAYPDFDVVHATSLSADAVPVLLGRLGELDATAQCGMAARLLQRWGQADGPGLRGWNLSLVRARRAVREREPELRALARECQRQP